MNTIHVLPAGSNNQKIDKLSKVDSNKYRRYNR